MIDVSMHNQTGGLTAHFEAMREQLIGFLRARMGSAADAEDLVQELWLRLARLNTEPIANPRAYLYRMALNLANDLVRERSRRRKRDAVWSDMTINDINGNAVDVTPSPEQATADRQELSRLAVAIRALPERAQEVFRQHRLEGKSHAEVAMLLNISKSAVEKHMATAMRHLTAAMNIDGPA